MNELSYLLLAAVPGGWELWIILLIVLILFGSRLPGIARSLGQGISQFKKGLNEVQDESNKDSSTKAPAPKDDANKPA